MGLFAESAMIMCTGFNCIPCMHAENGSLKCMTLYGMFSMC